ncbi:MAG: DsbC family protein [Burkholderiales bacterium]|nr:DsbC family protein [Burkholderiales bacterium]MDE2160589.1 DsbC family protein [Burkholderiales bacterium]MDE2504198.1 DsbC family protein [Burkholderiales bacterium]
MKLTDRLLRLLLAAAAALFAALPVQAQEAQEAAIRKVLTARLPQLKVDEVTRTAVPGIYEVRYGGTEILYTDEHADYVFTGSMVDTKTRADLTEQRIAKLTAVDFDKLPFKDSMVFRQGSGARKMAVFVDPNCGFCKRFERDLVQLKDVTIYTFMIPILSADSITKARDIWCSKDPAHTWRAWMLDGQAPMRMMGNTCDTSALDRNLAFAQKEHINGTPSVFFADGTRKPGAMSGAEVEKLLVATSAAAARKH